MLNIRLVASGEDTNMFEYHGYIVDFVHTF